MIHRQVKPLSGYGVPVPISETDSLLILMQFLIAARNPSERVAQCNAVAHAYIFNLPEVPPDKRRLKPHFEEQISERRPDVEA
jgi:hypothetical protein